MIINIKFETCVRNLRSFTFVIVRNLPGKSLRILGRDSKEGPVGCRAKAFPLDPAILVKHYTSENVG